MKGEGGRISVVIDNFTLIQSPIYGDLRKSVSGGEEHWLAFDVKMWQGHRAYVEFLDSTTHLPDDSAARIGPYDYLVVSRIIQSEHGSAARSHPADPRIGAASSGTKTPAELAQRYRELALSALKHEAPTRDEAELLNALIAAKLLVPDNPALAAEFKAFHDCEAALPAPRRVPGLADGDGEDEHIFIRGSPHSLGAVAPRRFLTALGGTPVDAPPNAGSGRLALAQKLTCSRRSALHARDRQPPSGIICSGAVSSPRRTTSANWAKRSRIELLDFLAQRFVADGWSIKTALREKWMLSATYQMDSRADPANDPKLDPANALLSHQRLKRLEGEAIRDEILAVSGTSGFEGIRPRRRCESHALHVRSRGRPNSGPLDGAGRRSLYMTIPGATSSRHSCWPSTRRFRSRPWAAAAFPTFRRRR